MRSGKKVINAGRWRIAIMYGGRYRFGIRRTTLLGQTVGFTAGLGVVVVTAFARRRNR